MVYQNMFFFPKQKTKAQDKLIKKQKQVRIGVVIMRPPYKKPTGPVETKYPRDNSIKGFKTKTNSPESYGKFHKKIMKDGPKNRTHGAGDTGNWQPHQFKAKKSTTTKHGQLNDADVEYKADKKYEKKGSR